MLAPGGIENSGGAFRNESTLERMSEPGRLAKMFACGGDRRTNLIWREGSDGRNFVFAEALNRVENEGLALVRCDIAQGRGDQMQQFVGRSNLLRRGNAAVGNDGF